MRGGSGLGQLATFDKVTEADALGFKRPSIASCFLTAGSVLLKSLIDWLLGKSGHHAICRWPQGMSRDEKR